MNSATHHRWLNARLLALVMMTAASSLQGQEAQYELVDRIAAVVGTTPIPMSRVLEQLQMLRLQNPSIPTDSASLDMLRQIILDTLIVEEMLVQAAERDTSIFVVE